MIVLKLFAVGRQKKKKEKSKGITLRLTWGILLGSFSDDFFKLQDKKTTKKTVMYRCVHNSRNSKGLFFQTQYFPVGLFSSFIYIKFQEESLENALVYRGLVVVAGESLFKTNCVGNIGKVQKSKICLWEEEVDTGSSTMVWGQGYGSLTEKALKHSTTHT